MECFDAELDCMPIETSKAFMLPPHSFVLSAYTSWLDLVFRECRVGSMWLSSCFCRTGLLFAGVLCFFLLPRTAIRTASSATIRKLTGVIQRNAKTERCSSDRERGPFFRKAAQMRAHAASAGTEVIKIQRYGFGTTHVLQSSTHQPFIV